MSNNERTLGAASAAAAGMLLGTLAAAAAPPPGYIEARGEGGAVISYPPDWEAKPGVLQFFAPANQYAGFSGDRPNLAVQMANGSYAVSQDEARAYLEGYASQLEESVGGYFGEREHDWSFETTRSEPMTILAGEPGWIMQYTFHIDCCGNQPDDKHAHMHVMAGMPDSNTTWIPSFNTPVELFDQFLPDVRQMINSFRVRS